MPPNDVPQHTPRGEAGDTEDGAAGEGRRRRRSWGALAWLIVPGLALAGVLFLVAVIQGRRAQAHLEAVRAKARAAGFALTPAELEAKLPAVDSPANGAPLYRKAFARVNEEGFGVDGSAHYLKPGRPVDEGWFNSAVQHVANNREVLDLLESAAAAEYTRFGRPAPVPPPEVHSFLDTMSIHDAFEENDPLKRQFRCCSGLLFTAAVLHAERGEAAAALSRIEEILVMGRNHENDPALLTCLLRQRSIVWCSQALEQVLARSEPSSADLVRWQKILLDEAEALSIRPFIEGEIAHLSMLYERLRRRDPEVTAAFTYDRGGVAGFLFRPRSANLTTDEAAALEAYLQIAEPARTGMGSTHGIRDLLFTERCRVAHALIYPWCDMYLLKVVRARIRLAATGIAARLFQRDHGRLPSSLGEMCPAYMPFVPLDPFANGAPLIFKTSADGLTVYSVGVNRTDDGGETSNQQDIVFQVIDRNEENTAK